MEFLHLPGSRVKRFHFQIWTFLLVSMYAPCNYGCQFENMNLRNKKEIVEDLMRKERIIVTIFTMAIIIMIIRLIKSNDVNGL